MVQKKMKAKMKRTRITFALAVLAGLVLVTPFPPARARKAVPWPQAAAEPCGTVTVAAASDLTYAMNEIASDFEKATGCTVHLSMGSSGNFLTQIENGAPFDVFLSADIAYPKKLESEGLATKGSTYLYAIGKIVLWTRNDSRVEIGKGLSVLRDPAVKRIAIANPEHAPYGRAAEEALRHAGVYDAVKDRLVLGENISQAAEFVESGNADAGIIALSLANSPALYREGQFNAIPAELYAPIKQGMVIPLAAPNPKGAQRFFEYVKTPAMSRVLENNGLEIPVSAVPGKKQ
jgi:molybdate transport system substrate-binding protein